MANAGAKFDNDSPPMSESEAGPIDMSDGSQEEALDSKMDMDEPAPLQTEIVFDDKGQMLDEQPDMVLSESDEDLDAPVKGPQVPEASKEPAIDHQEAAPEYLKTLAESQQQMADYMRLQQEQQYQQQQAQQEQTQRQSEAYYSSPEYVTKLCEEGGLDGEDAVHRQLVETRIDLQKQSYRFEQRMKQLEHQAQNQQYAQSHTRKLSALETSFNDAASQYGDASSEVISAARGQAKLLVDQGVTPERAVAESIKFVRLSAQQHPASKPAPAKRQARIDQLNSAGPGRGARSHRKTEMTMAEADMLVSRGGFFPN